MGDDDARDPRPPLDYATPAPRRVRWPWWVLVGLVAALMAAFVGVGF